MSAVLIPMPMQANAPAPHFTAKTVDGREICIYVSDIKKEEDMEALYESVSKTLTTPETLEYYKNKEDVLFNYVLFSIFFLFVFTLSSILVPLFLDLENEFYFIIPFGTFCVYSLIALIPFIVLKNKKSTEVNKKVD